MTFATPLTLSGPKRKPAQMLQEQEYGGHASVHDDAMAAKIGLKGAPIEGPTHFSLYPPLLEKIWGKAWFERGCISAHYQNMVIEGEETQALLVHAALNKIEPDNWPSKFKRQLMLLPIIDGFNSPERITQDWLPKLEITLGGMGMVSRFSATTTMCCPRCRPA